MSGRRRPAGRLQAVPPLSDETLAAASAVLGHVFRDPTLLREALNHASVEDDRSGGRRPERSNQRLEFLGDQVLDLVVSEWLLRRFPDEPEGGLTARLNALVRMEACAQVGRALDLGRFLRLGPTETDRVRALPRTLAETVEAVIAAMFVDGGLDPVRRFVERYWADQLERVVDVPREAKTALQEWTLGRGRGVPSYRLLEHRPDPQQPVFTVEVEAAGHTAMGEGASKRAAEQVAAARLLERLRSPAP